MNATWCQNCDYVHQDSMNKRVPERWLCTKFPRLEGHGFVAKDRWAGGEPFMRCFGINGGACPMFKARRDGQKELNMESTNNG